MGHFQWNSIALVSATLSCISLFISAFVSDLEWKMIYVGSAESEEHDQVLDTIYVGPIPEGKHMFVFQVSNFTLMLTVSPLVVAP